MLELLCLRLDAAVGLLALVLVGVHVQRDVSLEALHALAEGVSRELDLAHNVLAVLLEVGRVVLAQELQLVADLAQLGLVQVDLVLKVLRRRQAVVVLERRALQAGVQCAHNRHGLASRDLCLELAHQAVRVDARVRSDKAPAHCY